MLSQCGALIINSWGVERMNGKQAMPIGRRTVEVREPLRLPPTYHRSDGSVRMAAADAKALCHDELLAAKGLFPRGKTSAQAELPVSSIGEELVCTEDPWRNRRADGTFRALSSHLCGVGPH